MSWLLSLAMCAATQGPGELESVTRALEELHRSVPFLQVEASSRAERIEGDEWVLEGRWEVAAVLGTGGLGRFHCDYREIVLPWRNGPAPFAQDSMEVAFDGVIGTEFHRSTGALGAMRELERGQISRTPPAEFQASGPAATGLSYTVFARNLSGRCLLEQLQLDPGSFRLDEVQGESGAPCVQLTWRREDASTSTWTLDPARGMALLRMEYRRADGKVRNEVVVDELQEVEPGVFLPRSAHRRTWYGDRLERRAEFRADRYQVSAEVPEGRFRVDWPAGTPVYDTMVASTFHVAPDDAQLSVALTALADRVRADLEAKSSALCVTGPDGPAPGGAARAGLSIPSGWATALALGGAGLLLWALSRRRARSAVLVVLALGVVSGGTAKAQVQSVGVRDCEGTRLLNCGFNSCAFLLEWFDRGCTPQELDHLLAMDAHRNRASSLLQIKQALEDQGLEVEAFKQASLQQAIAMASPESPVLLHILRAQHQPAHFLLVAGSTEEAVYFIDPPYACAWIERQEAEQTYGRAFTGFLLKVQSPGPAVVEPSDAPPVASLPQDRVVHDLGVMEERATEFTVTIPVRNDGSETLEIVSGRGSCRCFHGLSALRLEPGQQGVLEARFDGPGFGTGHLRRPITAQLADGGSFRVDIIAEVRRGQKAAEVLWYPEMLVRGEAVSRLTFLVPPGARLRSPEGARAVGGSPEIAEQDPRRILEFEVDWSRIQIGTESLRFETGLASQPQIEIRLRDGLTLAPRAEHSVVKESKR